MYTLYGYWRSSAAYRVRIGLNLKKLSYSNQFVHLVKNGGEQHLDDYVALNPQHLVPTLVDSDTELSLSQSLAILEYLEEKEPNSAILPRDIKDKAIVRAMSLTIACEVHPLNNLRVLQYLTGPLALDEQHKLAWIEQWIHKGFSALEVMLEQYSGTYCFGNEITLADICLIPQVYNALRFNLDLSPYPNIVRIYQHCNTHTAFIDAAPENQPDAQ